jgi:Protein of unknown function (DUF2946)
LQSFLRWMKCKHVRLNISHRQLTNQWCLLTLHHMTNWFRKFVAILLLLWLPLFSGNALAASVAMQVPSGHCHDEAMQMMPDMEMSDMVMDPHQAQHNEASISADEQSTSCNSCGVCHIACTGYLAMPSVPTVPMQTSACDITPHLVSFRSITSTPLVPPPLARA